MAFTVRPLSQERDKIMSKLTCIWANLGEDSAAKEWSQATYVPSVARRLGSRVHHATQAE